MAEQIQAAPPKPFDFKKILALLGLLAVLGVVFLVVSKGNFELLGTKKPAGGEVVLEYWGLFEPESIFAGVIEAYEEDHPTVTINYTQKTFTDLDQYKTTLEIRSQQGTGPDIFRLHASWVPELTNIITPAPKEIMTAGQFRDIFYPVAYDNLVFNDSIYAIPLMYDGLALFYDPVRFEAANLDPPETWEQFREAAVLLTEKDAVAKKIIRSGAALGVGSNVAHASDIFGLMLAQNGVAYPDDLDTKKAEDVLTYYALYNTTDKVWDASFPNSLQAFANGQTAMILAPSWRSFDILSYNPRLNFEVAPVPQIPMLEERYGRVGWASFWAESVSSKSAHPQEAWEFIKYLSSKEVQQKLYAAEAVLRPFGEFYSRRDLKEALMGDSRARAFILDADVAVMWPIVDNAGQAENVAAVVTALDSLQKNISESSAAKTLKAKLTGVPLEE
ncbi:MAG: extracellular solute-binding protein [bacterium]